MVALLTITLVVGGLCLAMALRPGDTPRWMTSLVALLPTAIAMATTTLTLGMATFLALFLFFSRQDQDEQ